MKKSILQLSFLIATFFTINLFVAQQAIALTQGAEISFDKSTHDYGQIEKSANGECIFVFTNTGKGFAYLPFVIHILLPLTI